MKNASKFFDKLRSGIMGPKLDDDEVTGTSAILEAMAGLPVSWVAYALATSFHETAHTMQPIKEFGGEKYFTRRYGIEGQNPRLARSLGNTLPGDGAKYAGRGFVQITGRSNYSKSGIKLNVDLVNGPDLALSKDIAAMILRFGMREGWFTGKSFESFLPADKPATLAQFQAARRIINGTDKATLIAQYAVAFQDALIAGGWET